MVGEPLYTVFYGKPDSLAMGLFVFAVLQSTILGLYMVLSPMLQAMFRNRKAVLYFVYGSIAKIVLQLPTIAIFHSYGPLISTTIGLIIPNVLMYRDICQVTGARRKIILKRTILITILTLVMFILVGFLQWLLGFVFQTKWAFLEFPLCGSHRRDWRRSLWFDEPTDTTLGQDNRQSSNRPTTYTIENIVKRFINKSNEFNLSLTERFLYYIFLKKENFF